MSNATLQVEGFYDPATSTVSYIVLDAVSRRCALVDSVLDYDPHASRTSTRSADALVARVRALDAQVEWILETHVHADHLTAAPYLQQRLGGRIGIGSNVTAVQEVFAGLFNDRRMARDGSQFDQLFGDGARFSIGGLACEALHTPGHTPACTTYVVSDGNTRAAFVGDTLFMPDYGTARCDFPGGDARTLYRSVNRVLGLPVDTVLYLCHDYQPGGRQPEFVTTVGEQRKHNIHVRDGIGEETRDALRHLRADAVDGLELLAHLGRIAIE